MAIPDQHQLEKIWAQVPIDYYFRMNLWQRLWHGRKWQIFKSLIRSNGKSPQTILEVGCAAGHICGLLAKLFPHAQVVGVDIFQPAIKAARRRFPKLLFKVADAHRLPFSANSFDLVICSETIEHLVRPDQALHEMSRVVKPTGLCLIEMDSGSLLFRWVWYFWTRWGRGKVWSDSHLHPFTPGKLEQLIAKNGFYVKRRITSHLGMAVTFVTGKNRLST